MEMEQAKERSNQQYEEEKTWRRQVEADRKVEAEERRVQRETQQALLAANNVTQQALLALLKNLPNVQK